MVFQDTVFKLFFPTLYNCKYMNHKTENQGKLKIIFQKITGVPYIDTV